jgi:predicted permease
MNQWPSRSVSDAWQDIRVAARTLRRTPAFALVATLSLAFGFALTATTTAVVNTYLLRSLPYPSANRLYTVQYGQPGQPEPPGMSGLDWTSLQDVVELPMASASDVFYLTDGGYTQAATGLRVTPGFLEGLGVRVALGRSFGASEPDEHVALISQSLWRERFGSDPDVVGRRFRAYTANQAAATATMEIVGVLPPEFWYIRDGTEILVPLRPPARTYMVRLREGVPPAVAEQRLTAAAQRVASSLPPAWPGVRLQSVHQQYVASMRPILVAMTVAGAVVLLVVCTNVALLILLRTVRRQQELAVRVALGAGRGHLVRLLLAEIALIGAAAFAVGVGATRFLLRLLAPIIETQLGRPAPGGTSAIAIDGTVLLIVGGVGLVCIGLLALMPALVPVARQIAATLQRDVRTGSDTPRLRRLRSAVIALEVAASLALLVGCGLMVRTIVNLVGTDLGYRTDHIVRARIVPPGRTYPDAAALVRFYDRLLERVSAAANAPAALTNWPPFAAPLQQPVVNEGGPTGLAAGVVAISPGYFATLGIGIEQGRDFSRLDRLGAEPVAIVSETLARHLWPDGGAVGRRIRTGDQLSNRSPLGEWRTIVGLARNVRQTYTDADLNDIYIPFFQVPNRFAPIFIRTDRPASVWLSTLRGIVAEIDPEVTINGTNSLQSEGDRLLAGSRFLTSLLTAFAAASVLLALLGIYGVIAYAVEQRRHEVAIRMAIGATRRAIVGLFVRDGLVMLAVGVGGGLLGAAAVSKLLAAQLHGVQPFDLPTLVATSAMLVVSGLVATWWPARRAAQRSPIAGLREN